MFFRDIPGNSVLKSRLCQTVRENRISHAQLFYGSGGSGELALAIAYAQFISCTQRKTDDSCGVCPSCIKYAKLIHPDLHFAFPGITESKSKDEEIQEEKLIDKWRQIFQENPFFNQIQWYGKIEIENKQGQIGVKESTEIIRKLSLKPYESEYKVLIIWLPERLHPAAANKLLKTIEEPYEGTLILLVSESVNDILPTIVSRTQLIKIPRLENDEVREYVKRYDHADNQLIEDAVNISDGNINKALGFIKENNFEKEYFEQFVLYMRLSYGAKIKELLEWTDQMAKSGRENQKQFLLYGLRLVRENFLIYTGNPGITHLTDYEHEWSLKFSRFINGKNVADIYEELNTAFNHISANANPKLVFFDTALKLGKLLTR